MMLYSFMISGPLRLVFIGFALMFAPKIVRM